MFFFRKRLKKSTPEQDEAFRQMMQDEQVGFKDGFAMIVAAFITIVLPCALIICGIAFLMLLLFGLL